MANRQERLSQLQATAKEYVKSEKTRIENEVSVLEAVLKGRTGGAGVQKAGTALVEAVAKRSLAEYLKGA